MAKIIMAAELADLVSKLITDPSSLEQDMSPETYSEFLTDIAQVVCDYCGGEIHNKAHYDAEPVAGSMGNWAVGIHGNDSLPEDGGVWAPLDPDGSLFPEDDGQPEGESNDLF